MSLAVELRAALMAADEHREMPTEENLSVLIERMLEFSEAYWAKERARRRAWNAAHAKTFTDDEWEEESDDGDSL